MEENRKRYVYGGLINHQFLNSDLLRRSTIDPETPRTPTASVVKRHTIKQKSIKFAQDLASQSFPDFIVLRTSSRSLPCHDKLLGAMIGSNLHSSSIQRDSFARDHDVFLDRDTAGLHSEYADSRLTL